VHTPYNTRSEISTTAPWRPGVRARLLLAFLAITGFTALAAVAGIYAFREVGERLDVIDERVAPAIAALELSRSAERIIAAAPALLAAGQRQRRDEVRAELDREVDVLEATLADLSVQAGNSTDSTASWGCGSTAPRGSVRCAMSCSTPTPPSDACLRRGWKSSAARSRRA